MDKQPLSNEIRLAGEICTLLKKIYFLNDSWDVNLATKISKKLSHIKKNARNFFGEKSDAEILEILKGYKKEDFEDFV